MVIPTEFLTDANVQGDLLREYEQKFAELSEQQKLTKLCSNAGFSKNIGKGTILHLMTTGLDETKTSCREYTLPRSEETSRVRGWVRGNMEIGPVPDVKVCYHQGRNGVEIMIESLFRDRTVSWVRIVNGIIVTETSEEIPIANVENGGTGKLVAKAGQRRKLIFILTLVSIPYHERKWIDVDAGKFSPGCFEVSEFMIRLLRHGRISFSRR